MSVSKEFRDIIAAVYDEVSGGLDVNPQDSTNPLFRYFLINELKTDIILTSPITLFDVDINVSPGHGFVGPVTSPGEMITIFNGNVYMQQEVKSVAADVVTVRTPITSPFPIEGSIVYRGNKNMNIDGSVATGTPTDFKMSIPTFTIPIDVSKIILTMKHSAAGDDGKFGGISELAKGVYFRKENSLIFSLGNYRTNQDFKDTGGIVGYTQKGPGGTEATDMIFDIKEIFGQVIRIDPRLDDMMLGHVRDLLTGLDKFIVSIVGSYTSGE